MRNRNLTSRILVHAVLVVAALIILFPVYYTVIGSFMSAVNFINFAEKPWPSPSGTLQNYVDATSVIPLVRQYGNSLLVAFLVMAGQILTSVCAAFALVFLRVRFAPLVFALIMGTMMVPSEATIIPNFLTISDLGLMNSITGLVLPFIAAGFGVFLMRQAFKAFPYELYEAARMDGCSNPRFLLTILIPLTKPAIGALAIWSFLGAWNMYFWPLLVTQSPEMQTIQIGISQLNSAENFNGALIMAGAVLAMIPTFALVIFGQRYIVRGLTAGSGK